MALNEQQIAHRFASLDLEGQRGFLEKLRSNGLRFTELPIISAPCTGHIPLSYTQRSLWLTWKMDPTSPAYNLSGVLSIHGKLNVLALEGALGALIERHEILRTTYPVDESGEPHQMVSSDTSVVMPYLDIRELDIRAQSDDQKQAALLREQQRFAQTPFDLEQHYPFRATLWQLEGESFQLGLAVHHIAADGWSIQILIQELFALYEASCAGVTSRLAPLSIQYADYTLWEKNWLEAGERDRQLTYWQQRLGFEHPRFNLPREKQSTTDASSVSQAMMEARYPFQLSKTLSNALRQLGEQQGASLFMVILALLKTSLYKFTGETDLRVGVPLVNRKKPETHGLIGYLTNVQVLRAPIDSRQGFLSQLEAVKEAVLEAQAHSDLPFDLLVEALQPDRQAGTHPLFQVKCTEQQGLPDVEPVSGLKIKLEALSSGEAHFDLSLDFIDRPQGIEVELIFAADQFSTTLIEQVAMLYAQLAQQVVISPALPLALLDGAKELSQNSGVSHVWPCTNVSELFDIAVTKAPQTIALQSDNGALNYADLKTRVQALAAQLRSQGVGPEVRIAIHANRDNDFVVAMLAVIQAGGVYVPLDPDAPAERLRYILEDSGATILLNSVYLNWQVEIPVMDMSQPAALTDEIALISSTIHPDQTAYIIYTSGSTGRPKGVEVSHGALAQYVQAILQRMNLTESVKSMAMVSTVAADLGNTMLFGALCSGRTLHLLSAEYTFDPDCFAQYMAQHQVDVLKIVPSHLRGLLHAATPEEVLPRTCLILGGEATDWGLLDRIQFLRPSCCVLNHYGPTETTVGVLTQIAEHAATKAEYLPLGESLANCSAYVLGADLNCVPVGVSGELYLGGAQLAQGYLNQAAMTAERFVASPFKADERLYRTGDLVRQLPDGALAFLGRADDQVKVRGYRVELSEITQILRNQADVVDAVVIANRSEDGATKLFGYVVASGANDLDVGALRDVLVSLLPDYMIPDAIMVLDALPLTANGKLDRNALPEPEGKMKERTMEEPQGEVEHILAQIWADVLKVPQVGRHDNFFSLGGDSILTLQIVARARKQGLKLLPKQLMALQTIAAIAEVATLETVPAKTQNISQTEIDASFALTPIQAWFFEQDFDEPWHWNQSILLNATQTINLAHLRQAVTEVVKQHAALRLSFEKTNGVWQQKMFSTDNLLLSAYFDSVDLSGSQEKAADMKTCADEIQASLSSTQLFKAVWFELGAGRGGRLLLAVHHLVVDGVSWRILLEDLQTAYEQLSHARPLQLAPTGTSLAQWSQMLTSSAHSEALKGEMNYWQSVVGASEVSLPGVDDAENLVGDVATIKVSLDEDLTEQLLTEVHHAYRTQVNDVLLTALSRALCNWAQRDSVLIELEGHGRETLPGCDEQDAADLSRTVGWFTSLYPVRLSPLQNAPQQTMASSIKAIKEQLRAVPNNGVGYGLLRYLTDDGVALAQASYPQVTFNYLGQLDKGMDDMSLWRWARENAGEQRSAKSQRRTWLEIGASVHRGELTVEWHYNRKIHSAAQIQQLAQYYKDELTAVIEHCLSGATGITPSDYPLAKVSQAQLDALPLEQTRLSDLYPLSPMQSGMLFHSTYGADEDSYVNQLRADISGLDSVRFRASWEAAVERHDILRTGFIEGDNTLQWVATTAVLPFVELDIRGQSGWQQVVEAKSKEALQTGFDLSEPPLMRIMLIRVLDNRYHFIWTRHHLLLDGWSTGSLLAEVLKDYSTNAPIPAQLQYKNYIAWLDQRDPLACETYWRTLIGQEIEPTLLVPKIHSPSNDHGYCQHSLFIGAEQTNQIKSFAQTQRVTLNTVVQAAWALLLQKYIGSHSVIFGSTTSGRPIELQGIEGALGLFINTIPVVATPLPDRSVGAWLQELQLQNVDSREFEYTPLQEIQRWAGRAGSSLFDSIIVFENYPIEDSIKQAQTLNLSIENVQSDSGNHYPMTLRVLIAEEIRFELLYDASRIDHENTQQLATLFTHVLTSLVEGSDKSLCEVSLAAMPEPVLEKPSLVSESSILSYWQQFASTAGINTAVSDGTVQYSYQQLDQASDQLAARLVNALGSDQLEPRISLHVERSCEYVVGMLAIVKVGGVFVPMEPTLPQDRLEYMISDSRAVLMLTTQALDWEPAIPVLSFDAKTTNTLVSPIAKMALHKDQAAYVIYTSGSTGSPKGVVVSHGALANYVQGILKRFSLKDSVQRFAMVSTIAADLGHTMLFGALCSGRILHMMPAELAFDPDAFAGYMKAHQIDAVKLVPSHLQALLSAASSADVLPSQLLILGGEATQWSLLEQIASLKPTCQVINHYGPSETTVGVLTQEADRAEIRSATLPIGHTLNNCHAFLLDANMSPVPANAEGEMYIGGAQLGRGYQAHPAQTAERFVANPYVHGERLYRTGDRAVLKADGSLEYLGRIDDQVKVRGYRVELKEIANVLKSEAQVERAEVIARVSDLGQLKLYGYLVAEDSASFNSERLLNLMAKRLPEYMLPTAIMVLKALPLSANGKVDRKALPEPTKHLTDQHADSYEAPATATEVMLSEVWCEVLGITSVGRHDNFFTLGGDSILSLKVVARARKRGLKLLPKQLFEQDSLSSLANAIEAEKGAKEFVVPANKIPLNCQAIQPDMLNLVELDQDQIASIENAVPGGGSNIQDIYPLTSLQEGMLFHHMLQTEGDTYVTSRMIGFDDKANLDMFIRHLNKVITRQDTLRTAVMWESLPYPVQVVYRHAELHIDWHEPPVDADVVDWLESRFHSGHYRVDVRKAPMLYAAAAFDVANNRWLLVLLIHHLIEDNTTIKRVVEEVSLLQQGREDELTTPVPFRNYVAHLKMNDSSAKNEAFFREMLKDIDEPTAPFGVMNVHGDGSEISELIDPVEHDLASDIRQCSRALGISSASFFHLAWALVVAKTTGREDVVFGTVLFGRMQQAEATEDASGIYMNTLPIRFTIGQESIADCLRNTHQCLVNLFQHENASLSLAQRCSAISGGAPLFTSLLNFRYGTQVVEAIGPQVLHGGQILSSRARTNYPVGIWIDDVGEGFNIQAQVDEKIGAKKLCGYLKGALQNMVAELQQESARPIRSVELLPQSELSWLTTLGKQVHQDDDVKEAIHTLFEQRAKESPDAMALHFGDESVTYQTLNARANQLARFLIEKGVQTESRVGLCVERSIDMVVGVLAILKAGGAYVPLDPIYPKDRLAYMIEDSGIGLLLTQEALLDALSVAEIQDVITLDKLELAHYPSSNVNLKLNSSNLAYVIYTSGSTGRPKGAQLCHANVARLLSSTASEFRFGVKDVWTLFHSYAFDFSVWELFGALCTGGSLVIVPYWVTRSPEDFLQLLRDKKVSVLNQTPSAFGQLVELSKTYEEPLSLRMVIFGGEALDPERLRPWIEHWGDAKPAFINMYGITETTVHVTYRRIMQQDLGASRSPIGAPIADLGLTVLDQALLPSPVGVAGELYVSGAGLARGYLGRAGLTAERFVANPYGEGRLYRTGDLAKWTEDGQLEYLGRIDKQVKIRGFRIELGEIEAQIRALENVKETIVVAKQTENGNRLVAYVVMHSGINTLEMATRLREHLACVLPDYMVPSSYVPLDSIPITANGKVDFSALPEAETNRHKQYEPPIGDVELALADIWSDVLGVNPIGRQDSFFELGGDSLVTIKVKQLIKRQFSVDLHLRLFFENTTLSEMGHVIQTEQFKRQGQAKETDAMMALLEELED